jgi:hypothetical protein
MTPPGAKLRVAGHDHGDRTHDAKPDEGEDLRIITQLLARSRARLALDQTRSSL